MQYTEYTEITKYTEYILNILNILPSEIRNSHDIWAIVNFALDHFQPVDPLKDTFLEQDVLWQQIFRCSHRHTKESRTKNVSIKLLLRRTLLANYTHMTYMSIMLAKKTNFVNIYITLNLATRTNIGSL